MSKEKIITAVTFIVLLGAFALGIFFLVRLVNGPGSDEKSSDIMSGELQTYTHPDYGFTFNYPAGFKLGKFPEGEGEVILVQKTLEAEQEKKPDLKPAQGPALDTIQGFQIFVSLYEEKNPLSKAIIQESAPDLKIDKFEEISLKSPALDRDSETQSSTLDREKSNFIPAFSFDTDSTHEVWFVQDGNLYQVTSYREFGERMEGIIKTIRFN